MDQMPESPKCHLDHACSRTGKSNAAALTWPCDVVLRTSHMARHVRCYAMAFVSHAAGAVQASRAEPSSAQGDCGRQYA